MMMVFEDTTQRVPARLTNVKKQFLVSGYIQNTCAKIFRQYKNEESKNLKLLELYKKQG